MIKAENTPKLTTESLILRKFTYTDLEHFYTIFKDDEVTTFMPWYSLKSLEEAKGFYERKFKSVYENAAGYHYAICLKENNIPIGYIKANIEEPYDFGYGLKKEYWGQNIVVEAGKTLLAKLKENGFPYVTATHDVHNSRSGSVLKKLGFSYKYTYQKWWQPKNILVDFRMFQLNFGDNGHIYKGYWNQYSIHYVEENV